MATTPHLDITLIEASQAQKEVTVNTALMRIDAILNSGVIDKDLTAPPVSPASGDVYIVATSAMGAWAGKEKNLAYFDQIWRFIAPRVGLQMWVVDESIHYVFNGTNWVSISITGESNTASNVGASGVGVFKQKSGIELQFKKLVAGSNMTISGGADDVTISGAAAAGETNTGSNIGTAGVGVFKQKTGVNFEFKKINAGSNKITITDDTANNEVDINVTEANLALASIGGTLANAQITAANITQHIASIKPIESMVIALGDETTAITVGNGKVTFRMPYAFTVTAVRASVTTASTSGIPTFDINENGVSILGAKLTIDATEKTSVTAATAATITDAAIADDAEITIDVDVAGTGAIGAKIVLIGNRI